MRDETAASGRRSEDADVETSSEGYARRFAGPVGAFFLEVQTRLTRELLAPWPAATILDVGGGHGQITGPLVDLGFDVTVFGSSDACQERVRRWVDSGRARFQSGDLLALPFPERAFDVVVSYRLLPHVRAWPHLVRELTRVALSAVVVDYPTRRSLNLASGAFFGLKKGVEGNTRPFTVFGEAEVRGAFAANGFRITDRRPEFFWPMALHRALGLARLSRLLERGASLLGLTRALGSPVLLRTERRG